MHLDVWIDTDPAVGVPDADVDDGFALIQAFNSPELRIHGVSAVFGNAPLAQCFPIATEIVSRFGPPGLIAHAGAAAAEELGVETPASAALAAALAERPLDVLALGPVTNVATVVRRHPELLGNLRRIICVAGRRPGQEFRSTATQRTPFPDMNFECDPAGMQVLVKSGVPLLLAGWEVSSHVWIRGADIDRLGALGGAPAWLAERSRGWLRFWKEQLDADGFNPFDTLAIAAVATPQLVETVEVSLTIEEDETRPLLLARPEEIGGRRAVYCTRPAPSFKADLLARLASSPRP